MMNRQFIDEFIDELSSIKDKNALWEFMQGILTEKELHEIPARLQIIRMLKAGIAQHAIAEKLQVGVATVTRGSKELQQGRFKQIKPYGQK